MVDIIFCVLCFGALRDVAPTDMAYLRLKGGKEAKFCGILILKMIKLKY